MPIAVISIGSNLGDRIGNCRKALEEISAMKF
jgi:7,8-dihydro-6-hydroxymethylpterin-pyrophosphokinase